MARVSHRLLDHVGDVEGVGERAESVGQEGLEGADAFGSTFGDLVSFFDEYLGTDSSAIGSSSDLGGSVEINANGQIVVVGNEGTVQALDIETGDITVNGPVYTWQISTAAKATTCLANLQRTAAATLSKFAFAVKDL